MKKKFIFFLALFIIITIVLSYVAINYKKIVLFSKYLEPSTKYETIEVEDVYYAEDFNIETIKSHYDADNDGIDDYSDIVEGARIDAKNMPKYVSNYYQGGYPPDDEGVCADLFWRAFKNAGYNIKDLVDEDISKNISLYPRVAGKPDPNIDFRRVANLTVYLKRNHQSLTIDLSKIEEWQPGDIVVFSNDRENHIAIVSDKRNEKGIPYIIHNAGQPNREEDGLEFYNEYAWPIVAHYRWTDYGI